MTNDTYPFQNPGGDGNDHFETQIRDLSDFCLKWNELRCNAMPDGPPPNEVKPEARSLQHWLVLLADRVCMDPDSS